MEGAGVTQGTLFPHAGDYPRSGAAMSTCKRYRYSLWRDWKDGDRCNFIMLNPSTADATLNDPTVERCQRRAHQWGYGGLVVSNLFALRSTDPKALLENEDPIGRGDNDLAILSAALASRLVVCAWGNHGSILDRSTKVRDMLVKARIPLYYLKLAKAGEPCHPLYLPYSLKPILWDSPGGTDG